MVGTIALIGVVYSSILTINNNAPDSTIYLSGIAFRFEGQVFRKIEIKNNIRERLVGDRVIAEIRRAGKNHRDHYTNPTEYNHSGIMSEDTHKSLCQFFFHNVPHRPNVAEYDSA